MNNENLFFAILGSFIAVNSILFGVIKLYVDAKIDPIKDDVKTLVQYMILHEEKIATQNKGKKTNN